MAKIEDLVLTVSRNTDNQVSVKVTYIIHFSETERQRRIEFAEMVKLWEREGIRDDTPPQYAGVQPPNPPDRAVTEWYNVRVGAEDPIYPTGGELGPIRGIEKLPRAWEKTLTTNELKALRDPGREHPYVTVVLQPNGVTGDSKISELAIDIGDPNE